MKNCKEVFQVTSKETAGDLMTILEAKRKTRLAVWQQHIQSSGLTVRAWCTQNGCSEKSYYYWLRLVRERMLEQAEGQP